MSYAAPVLTWTGDLAPGDTATITYSVTVEQPRHRRRTCSPTPSPRQRPAATARSGSTDPDCTATVDVSELTIVNTASASTTTPGGVVGYTITATNSGQAAIAGATLTADLAPVLDDATYNGDADRHGRHRHAGRRRPEPDLDRGPGRRRHA